MLTIVILISLFKCFISNCDDAVTPITPVPMISISLSLDVNRYVRRLIASIDYPVENLFVMIGNDNISTIEEIKNDINTASALAKTTKNCIRNIQIDVKLENPGAAFGFNYGLHKMMARAGVEYVLICNSDVSFFPHTLSNFSASINKHISDPNFGIGFTGLCCGGEWSTFAITRRLVEYIGFFDENIYPAYYEDTDYAFRIHLSGMKAYHFPRIHLIHGSINGSSDYISGIQDTLLPTYGTKAKEVKTNLLVLRCLFEKGLVASKKYIHLKW